MTATIYFYGGRYVDVPVRYSSAINGLFTTTDMLQRKGVKAGDAAYANAPVLVYDGAWNDSGFSEEPGFFAPGRCVADIPFADLNWNYR